MYIYVPNLHLFISPVEPAILTRIEETFKRVSSAAGYLPQATFTRDVLGDGVPAKLAEVHIHGYNQQQCLSACIHVHIRASFKWGDHVPLL